MMKMMNTLIHKMIKQRRGFTLVEVLIALAISGLIGGAIATSIVQMFDVNHQNTSAITAQRQVQQVGYYMSRDGQNAQTVTLNATPAGPAGTNFAVRFTWTDWITGDLYAVTYSLTNGGVINRTQAVTSAGVTTTSPAQKIAENISTSSANTVFQPVGGSPGLYILTVTASISGKIPVSETRIYEIRQRTV